MARVRCAIYTRKSSEEGLEQDFNSLHAQREACEAYISSQKHEGWVALPDPFDDGGLSGGTLERPALTRLMQQIDAGRIDQIVVYKIDRLTRSLADFARLVDRLDAARASFVSVTQSFNTATSMGRLTLNVLLSFAQFEREVTAERIRDKIAASKKKGLWMGGLVPLGYEADGRSLKIRADEATTVRTLYDLYLAHGTLQAVQLKSQALGLRSRRRVSASGEQKGGNPLGRSHIHHILSNPVYAGRIRHGRNIHEGLHAAIIVPALWEEVQQRLQRKAAAGRGAGGRSVTPSPLIGKLFDETGDRLTPSHTRKGAVRHRYYVSHRLVKSAGMTDPTGWRLPAAALEERIAAALRAHLAGLRRAALRQDLSSDEIVRIEADTSLTALDPAQLFGLITRGDLATGRLTLALNGPVLKDLLTGVLKLPENSFDETALRITLPFTARKRGVETKLVIGDAAPERDEALIRNIARAHRWFAMLRAGQSFDQIAAAGTTSKRRLQQVTDWALLAPDITASILAGTQPKGLTSDWLLRHTLPTDWAEQRRLIAAL